MKNLIKIICTIALSTTIFHCSGGGSGETKIFEDITLTELPEVTGEPGDVTINFLSSYVAYLDNIEENYEDYLAEETSAEEKNAFLTTLASTRSSLQESQGLITKFQNGEEVTITSFSVEGEKTETVLTSESLTLSDQLILDYEEKNKTSETSIDPKIIYNVCDKIGTLNNALAYVGRITAGACGLALFNVTLPGVDEAIACGAFAYNSKAQVAGLFGKLSCMILPTQLDSIEIYPERPCLKAASDLYPDGDSMKILVEGHFKNALEGDELIEELIDQTVDNFLDELGPVEKLFVPLKNQIVSQMSEVFVKGGEELGVDLSAPVSSYQATFEIDPSDANWKMPVTSFSDGSSTSSKVLYSFGTDYKLTSYEWGGKGTIQATITDWPSSPNQTFESSVRDVRVSTPPTLARFDVPNYILGDAQGWHASGSAENAAAQAWLNDPDLEEGYITIQDDEKDLLWAYFADGDDLGAYGVIYGEQTSEQVEVYFPKGNYDDPLGFISTIPGPSSKTVAFRARDLCGNDVILVDEHTFNWGTCPSDSFTCYVGSPEEQQVYADYGVISGLNKNAGIDFYEAIDDLGNYHGEGDTSSWESNIDENGNFSFGGKPWIEILKEEDALK